MSQRRRVQRSRFYRPREPEPPARPIQLIAAEHFLTGLAQLTAEQLTTIRDDNRRAMADHDAGRCDCEFITREEPQAWVPCELCASCEPRWQLAVLLEALLAYATAHPEQAGKCECCGDPLSPRGPVPPPDIVVAALEATLTMQREDEEIPH